MAANAAADAWAQCRAAGVLRAVVSATRANLGYDSLASALGALSLGSCLVPAWIFSSYAKNVLPLAPT